MVFDRRGTPLGIAVQSQQSIEFVAFLLSLGADPNQDQDCAPPIITCAVYFCKDQNMGLIKLLLEYGAYLNGTGALQTAGATSAGIYQGHRSAKTMKAQISAATFDLDVSSYQFGPKSIGAASN
ncbi:MAG: hypothetical protein M1814_000593 [Vezdaea aestivalis]|nr:MAG: hypothetical protein M1814_000593 [Vezdaea aestivalis]